MRYECNNLRFNITYSIYDEYHWSRGGGYYIQPEDSASKLCTQEALVCEKLKTIMLPWDPSKPLQDTSVYFDVFAISVTATYEVFAKLHTY